jgi:predicted permease
MPVLAFALAACLVTAVLSGLGPALASSADPQAALREPGGAATPTRRRQRLRRGLIVGQLAAALVLLAGSGVLTRSVWALLDVDPGYRTEGLVTTRISLPQAGYATDAQRRAFFAQIVERVGGLPGVAAAGAVSRLPLAGRLGDINIQIEGREKREGEVSPALDWQVVTPGYFRAMGMRIVRGRGVSSHDTGDMPGVVVINQAAVRRHFAGEDPLGQRFLLGGGAGPGWVSVVGIVSDVRHRTLGEPSRPEMYLPHQQFHFWHDGPAVPSMTLVVHAPTAAGALAPAIRRQVAALDPNLPVSEFVGLERLVERSVARPRFVGALLGAFAVIAVLLATIGTYGVVAYAVSSRTRELGIRMALGAMTRDIFRMVLRQGVVMVTAGIGLGLLAALALTRLLTGLLYGVGPGDPATLVTVSLVLAAAGMAACAIPALRATRVDPAQTLRSP